MVFQVEVDDAQIERIIKRHAERAFNTDDGARRGELVDALFPRVMEAARKAVEGADIEAVVRASVGRQMGAVVDGLVTEEIAKAARAMLRDAANGRPS